MNIANNAKPVKRVLLLLLAAAPFLFIGWYMVAGIVMALIIKLLIPDKLNNDDRKTATVLWCILTSIVLALSGYAPFLISWAVTCSGMLAVAWPKIKYRNRRRRNSMDRYGYVCPDNRIIITDAEVIDVDAGEIDT